MRRSPSARYVASSRSRSCVAAGAERLERALERLAAKHGRARILELAEAGIEADGERMRPQQPVAEAVDRRDPGTVELAREIGAAALDERRSDPRAQLARRLARVRDDEDRVDVEAALAHRADVALDEHRRLARARTSRDEHDPCRLDRRQLLVVQRGSGLDDAS